MPNSITRLVADIKKLQAKADDLSRQRETVLEQTHELLAKLDREVVAVKAGNGHAVNGGGRSRRANSLKGRKVAAKYRGPKGETWAGRGLMPLWLKDAIKKGRKKESFLIKRAR